MWTLPLTTVCSIICVRVLQGVLRPAWTGHSNDRQELSQYIDWTSHKHRRHEAAHTYISQQEQHAVHATKNEFQLHMYVEQKRTPFTCFSESSKNYRTKFANRSRSRARFVLTSTCSLNLVFFCSLTGSGAATGQTLLLWVFKSKNWVYLVENCQLCMKFGQKRQTLQATKFCKNFVHSPSFY